MILIMLETVLMGILKICAIIFLIVLAAFLMFVLESLIVCKWQELQARWKYQKVLKQQLKDFEKTLIESLSKCDDSDEI